MEAASPGVVLRWAHCPSRGRPGWGARAPLPFTLPKHDNLIPLLNFVLPPVKPHPRPCHPSSDGLSVSRNLPVLGSVQFYAFHHDLNCLTICVCYFHLSQNVNMDYEGKRVMDYLQFLRMLSCFKIIPINVLLHDLTENEVIKYTWVRQ